MADSRALEDALTCDSSTFYCIATDGGEVVALPTDLAPYAASCEPPENPTSLFDPASYGTVISTFLAAITEGYGVTIVMMTDGSSRQVEIFNRFDELGCGIVCLTETDAIPEFEQATPLELPTRRVTSRMNGAGRTLDVDEGITRLLGWTVDEYVGLSSVDKIHPDDQERAIRAFAELLGRPNGQSRTRQRVRHKDGTWRWFEITHTNLLDADDSHILSESIDISDEMQVTLELQERETLLRLLTESLPVGVLHVHANGEPGMPNPAWACLTNTDRNDGVEEFLNRLTDGDAVRRLLDSARDDGMVNDLSVTFDGDRPACRHADLAIRPLSADAPPFSLLLTLTDTSESVATHTALHRQSRHDHLTGALNRRGLEERVTEVLKDRRTSRVTVLYCDLNDFKGINDSHGHYTGDAVLEAVATEISGELRPDDLVGRWGGDEFLIVLVDLDPDDVTLVVNRIERRLSGRTDLLDGHELTMSVGRADAEPGDDFDSLLRRADAAMYDVKSQWRARRVG